jgi:hypothetical protein
MLKRIVSATPTVAFAAMIAARSDPATGALLLPLSAVVVTVTVKPCTRDTKASEPPPVPDWKGETVGKLVDSVVPAT